MNNIAVFVLAALLTFWAGLSWGHHHDGPGVYIDVSEIDLTLAGPSPPLQGGEVAFSDSDYAETLAYIAAVGQHHFDHGTYKWQGSVGGGFADDESAVSFALGKRFEGVNGLFTISYGQVNDNSVFGFGGSFRF